MSNCHGVHVTKRTIVIQTGLAKQGLSGPPGNQQVSGPLTLIGNIAEQDANPTELTVSEVKSLLGYASSEELSDAMDQAAFDMQASLPCPTNISQSRVYQINNLQIGFSDPVELSDDGSIEIDGEGSLYEV